MLTMLAALVGSCKRKEEFFFEHWNLKHVHNDNKILMITGVHVSSWLVFCRWPALGFETANVAHADFYVETMFKNIRA